MKPVMFRIVALFAVSVGAGLASYASAAEWFVSPEGQATNAGTQQSPWDLASAVGGRHKVAPGDTISLMAGTYKYPDRGVKSKESGGKENNTGFAVKVAGSEDAPITIRPVPGQRATIDGGMAFLSPYVIARDLEVIVSECLTDPRRIEERGSDPKTLPFSWGGVSMWGCKGSKFINLIIHDNGQGMSWWTAAVDTEVYGCIIYNNGWEAPDRGHGHGIYTQNKDGVKHISDCIFTGGHGYSLHAYGSKRADISNYLIEHNILYNAGTMLMGGDKGSTGMVALSNYLYNVSMQLGYRKTQNEDCEVKDNFIVDGTMTISNFKTAVNEGNQVIGKTDPRPAADKIVLRPNKYDSDRANLAIFNFKKTATVQVDPQGFLKAGESYRLMSPTDFFGKPVATGTFDGKAISVPVAGEFGVFVLLKGPAAQQ